MVLGLIDAVYRSSTVAPHKYRRVQSAATAFWTPLRFLGQYHDEECDLNQNWNRFYDPVLGRDLESDPLAELSVYLKGEGYNGQLISVYPYVGNNPLAGVDPAE